MRIFIYKSIIISVLIVIVYKITILSTVKNYEKKLFENFNKEKIEFIKIKIKDEIRSSIQKEKIINKEDALLINNFLKKIKEDLDLNN